MSTNHKPVIVELSAYLSRLAQDAATPLQPLPQVDPHPSVAGPATPLVDRVRTLLATIPSELSSRGMSIEWFRSRLRGKYRRHAMAGDVAQALRELGWVRKRGWRQTDDGFRAKWYPPVDQPKERA